jgi:mannosyltransferase
VIDGPARTLSAVRRRDWLRVAALTAAASVLRFATIDVQSYWFDESLTAHLLRLPFGDMLRETVDRELTPPLYYLIAWPWAHVVGSGEPALRSLSALFGIATVPVAWLAARRLASPRAGLVVAALVAFNPLLVWYSQEARPYALWTLLGALSILLWGRAQDERSGRALALWTVTAVLALATHYYAVFLIVPQGLWLLWIWRPRLHAVAALGAIGAVGSALVPLAVHQNERIGTGYISGLGLARRLFGVPEDFLTGFVIGFNTPVEQVLAAVTGVVAVAGLGWAALRARGDDRRGALLAAALAVAALGLPAVLALGGLDYLNTRNVLIACLPALMVVGIGLAAGRRAGVAGAAVLCAAGVAATAVVARDPDYQREDWRSAAEALGPARGARVVVVPAVSGPVGLTIHRDGVSVLGAGGAAVTEIDVVTPRNARLQGPDWARPAAPRPPLPGFDLAERRYEDDYTLLRYRSRRPVVVTPEAAVAGAPGVIAAPVVLIERPGSDAPSASGL